jgi:hypothetical protein
VAAALDGCDTVGSIFETVKENYAI